MKEILLTEKFIVLLYFCGMKVLFFEGAKKFNL